MSSIQERWNDTFSKLVSEAGPNGRTCPSRRADESSVDYLRRLSRIGRRYIPAGEPIAKVQFDHTLPDDVVAKFSEQMRQAVERSLYRTDNMAPGDVRAVLRVDEATGQKIREYYGPRVAFIDNMGMVRKARLNRELADASQRSKYPLNRADWAVTYR
jgi:hypothetical protein